MGLSYVLKCVDFCNLNVVGVDFFKNFLFVVVIKL